MNTRLTTLLKASAVIAAVLVSTGPALARVVPPPSLPDSGNTLGMAILGLIALGATHRVLRRGK
jgi:hypothetical protein